MATGNAPFAERAVGDAPIALQLVFSQVPAWLGLMVPTAYAVWKKGNGFVRDLGLRMTLPDVPLGLVIGVASQLLLVPAIYWVVFRFTGEQDVSEVARQITDKAVDPFSAVVLFLMVGIGAPVVEEIYFRGLTLRSAERRFGPMWALVGTSFFFAAIHLSVLVIPGLVVFALILGWLTQRTGRLGPAIFAHIGFNLVTAAVLVFNLDLPGT